MYLDFVTNSRCYFRFHEYISSSNKPETDVCVYQKKSDITVLLESDDWDFPAS